MIKIIWGAVWLSIGIGCLADTFQLEGLRVTHLGNLGPTSNRVDLVIAGDGYIAEDFRPKGKWEVDTARLVKNFFEKEPFKSQKALFNVHLVEVHSLDRGADENEKVDKKRTAFNCCYGISGIQRLLGYRDEQAVLQAAGNAPAADIIIVLVNDGGSGGSGGSIEAIPAPTSSAEASAYLTAIHELGHSFANLGDEYVDEKVASTYPLPESGDFTEPNLTLAKFVDASSPERLIETLKWGHFLEEPGGFKKYGRGYFEGGYYRAKGIYRPAQNCTMADLEGGGVFCFVCNDVLTRSIYRTASRGPGGGIFPEELPRIGGRLRSLHFIYTQGLFGRLLPTTGKLEKSANLSGEEREQVAAIRKGFEATFQKSMEKLNRLWDGGEIIATQEYLELLDISFKGTERHADIRTRKKEITGAAGFSKEVQAEKDFLQLQWASKSMPRGEARKNQLQKQVDSFLKKHAGTKAAEKARRLLEEV